MYVCLPTNTVEKKKIITEISPPRESMQQVAELVKLYGIFKAS